MERTEAQAAIAHFQGNLTKIMFAAKGRDAEAVMQEIAQDFAILIADMNQAKADEYTVPSKRDVKHIGDDLHDTVHEAFADTNAAIEAQQSFIDPNEEHRFGHMEHFGRRH